MNYVIRILAVYFISANLFSSIYAGLLMNLLLGGNQAPEQGLNLSFGNLDNNNNQEIQNDYPDYNIGTSRDSTVDRPNNFQQQNYSPEGTNFNQPRQDYHQNEYSGSQEYGYNKEPPSNQEDRRLGSSEVGTSSINQNIPRQQTNVGKNYGETTIDKPKINSSITKTPLEIKKTMTAQNSTLHLHVQEINNLNNSDIESGDTFPLKLNNSNDDTKNTSNNVLKEVPKNDIKNKSKHEEKNLGKTKDKNVLKPITKRKFFFQVKPVLPDVSTNKETIFYVD